MLNEGQSPARFLLALACCGALLATTSLVAQSDDKKPDASTAKKTDKPVVKTDITVTAQPSPVKTQVTEDIRSLPVNASVLFDPATEVSNAREPGEIIRALPGMDFVFYGQGGIPSGPSVRGYTDRNFGQDIAGFLDGIPLNLFGFVASHGAMDLTTLLPQSIERIELIRGPFNARYGDFHRGGSLNVRSRESRIRRSTWPSDLSARRERRSLMDAIRSAVRACRSSPRSKAIEPTVTATTPISIG